MVRRGCTGTLSPPPAPRLLQLGASEQGLSEGCSPWNLTPGYPRHSHLTPCPSLSKAFPEGPSPQALHPLVLFISSPHLGRPFFTDYAVLLSVSFCCNASSFGAGVCSGLFAILIPCCLAPRPQSRCSGNVLGYATGWMDE